MVADSKQAQKQLYETDYHLWVLATVEQLQNREFETIDTEILEGRESSQSKSLEK
jgi:hypothetical protein